MNKPTMFGANLARRRGWSEETRRRFWYYLGPPLIGAAVIAACVAPAVLEFIFKPHQTWQMWKDYLYGLAAAAGIGFAGGAAYVLFGRRLRRVPRVGPYLAGIVTMTAYMGAALAFMSFGDDKLEINGRADAIIFAACTIIFGCVFGFAIRDRTPDQLASDQRTASALEPLKWIALVIFGGTWLVLGKVRSEATYEAALVLGLVALVGAWIYLRRRPRSSPP